MRHDRYVAAAFLLLAAFAPTTRNIVLLAAYALTALYVLGSRVSVFAGLDLRERVAALLLVLSLTVMLPFSVVQSATALVHYCVALVSLGCAFILTRNLPAYLAASRLTLLVAQLALFVYLAVAGMANLPLENLFSHTSGNGITSTLVLLQVNYSIVNFLVHRRMSLVTAGATLALCIIGYGRGSILAAAGVVFLSVLFLVRWGNARRAVIGVVALATIGAVLYFQYGRDAIEFVQANTKIGAGLYDESRERMITEYLGQIDAGELIAGASYRGTSIETEFYGNPHNSFIRAHHIFGLPYLVATILFPVIVLWNKQRLALRLFSLGMIAIVLFRAVTEPLLFPTAFDCYFFAICFALNRRASARVDQSAPLPREAGSRLPGTADVT